MDAVGPGGRNLTGTGMGSTGTTSTRSSTRNTSTSKCEAMSHVDNEDCEHHQYRYMYQQHAITASAP